MEAGLKEGDRLLKVGFAVERRSAAAVVTYPDVLTQVNGTIVATSADVRSVLDASKPIEMVVSRTKAHPGAQSWTDADAARAAELQNELREAKEAAELLAEERERERGRCRELAAQLQVRSFSTIGCC